jgi:hypothetical protein
VHLASGGPESAQEAAPKGRLWLNDGSCRRLRPERPRHVGSYEFASAQTHDGRSRRLLMSSLGNAWRSANTKSGYELP